VARRARTATGLVAVLAALVIVAAAVTALPPAAGAAAPLRHPSRTASSPAADTRSPAPAIVVVIAGTVRPVPHPTRPHPSSSAAFHRPPEHAFRATPLAGHPTVILVVLVVPAQAPRAPPCGAEATDRFAVAGGDPVNEGDPSGEASVNLEGTAAWAIENLSTSGDDDFDDDCTDFVSRALYYGGGDPETSSDDFYWDALHKHDLHLWFQVQDLFGLTETSSTWANAGDLAQHLKLNGSHFLVSGLELAASSAASSSCSDDESTYLSGNNHYDLPADVQPGDVIFADWNSGSFSGITHAGVIVTLESEVLIAQHTPDRFDTLQQWQEGGADPHVWIVDPNDG
jgi:Putative amidase domain